MWWTPVSLCQTKIKIRTYTHFIVQFNGSKLSTVSRYIGLSVSTNMANCSQLFFNSLTSDLWFMSQCWRIVSLYLSVWLNFYQMWCGSSLYSAWTESFHFLLYFRFSQRWRFKSCSPGMWRQSFGELCASIFRVTPRRHNRETRMWNHFWLKQFMC